jgi:Transglutaminase-like superfamily
VIRTLPPRLWRRARLLAGCLHSPRDVLLALRMVGWRLAVPPLKWALPLPRLVRVMWTEGRWSTSEADRQRIVTLAHALYGPRGGRLLDNCLERSLVTYRFLAEAGADPQLVVAVSDSRGPVRGHVWVTVDGAPLREDDEPLEEFAPMVMFGRGGVAISGESRPAGPTTTPTPPGPGSTSG